MGIRVRGCWFCEPHPAGTATEDYRVRIVREPLCAACRVLSDLRRQLAGLEPLQPEIAQEHPDLVAEAREVLASELAVSDMALHWAYQVRVGT
ncbi:hypothetical protein [Microtetraspora malaysiensis]|uniref:hypothetical protein n=1 Tax=Microtetraspora malaysiensis TaxID=161358 RepID=UPI003D8FFF94